MSKATMEQVAEVAETARAGRVWRHPAGTEVRVYQGAGYLVLTPDFAISDGREIPAVRIAGRLDRASGAAKQKIRDAARTLGFEVFS